MTPYTFFGRPVDDEILPTLPDYLVLKETCPGGVLIVRRRTERHVVVPMPRKPVES